MTLVVRRQLTDNCDRPNHEMSLRCALLELESQNIKARPYQLL